MPLRYHNFMLFETQMSKYGLNCDVNVKKKKTTSFWRVLKKYE